MQKPRGGELLGASGRGGGRGAPFAWRGWGEERLGNGAAGEGAEPGRGFGRPRSPEELPPPPLRRCTGARVRAAALPGSLLLVVVVVVVNKRPMRTGSLAPWRFRRAEYARLL